MHKLSKFLPGDFDESAKLALLAGKGQYPEILHRRLKSAGIEHILMAFEDETSPELWNDFDASKRYIMNVKRHLWGKCKRENQKAFANFV